MQYLLSFKKITENFKRIRSFFQSVQKVICDFCVYHIEVRVKSKNSDDVGDVTAPSISRTSHPDNFLPVAVVVDAERNFADSAVAEPGFFFGLS